MNIILFHPSEVELPLRRSDLRACHLLEVLRRQTGDTFDAGLINGPKGKGQLVAISTDALELAFTWTESPEPPAPIHLLVGMPRPQTSRDILRDITSLGVTSLHFFRSEKGEASYASSSLWQSGEWRRHAISGAAQAFSTGVPQITFGQSFNEAINSLPASSQRLALDNYESTHSLSYHPAPPSAVALAIGSERGWSAGERTLLQESGFNFAHLGSRVLRTETACVVAVALIRAKLGLL